MCGAVLMSSSSCSFVLFLDWLIELGARVMDGHLDLVSRLMFHWVLRLSGLLLLLFKIYRVLLHWDVGKRAVRHSAMLHWRMRHRVLLDREMLNNIMRNRAMCDERKIQRR